MAIEQFYFDVDDLKMALYNGTGSYGTAVDVMGVSQFRIDMQTVNAELPGDAQIIDTHARGIKAIVTAKFAFYNLAPYALITNTTVISSTGREVLKFDNFNPPYVGIAAQIKSSNGAGDAHLWLPKVKLMSGFQLGGEYGNYVTPEITFTALNDATDKIFTIVKHSTATTLVIPVVATGS